MGWTLERQGHGDRVRLLEDVAKLRGLALRGGLVMVGELSADGGWLASVAEITALGE